MRSVLRCVVLVATATFCSVWCALAQKLTVLPKCGAPGTRFIATLSYPACPTCPQSVSVDLDFRTFSSVAFPAALDTLCADICPALVPGGHTLTVQITSGCDCEEACCNFSATILDTFRVLPSITSPWDFSTIPTQYGSIPTFHFIPHDTCGFPRCDDVELIQVVRVTGYDSLGTPRSVTENESARATGALYDSLPTLRKAFVDSLDAWTTPANYRIDLLWDHWHLPYYTQSGVNSYGRSGRVGSSIDTTKMTDMPRRSNRTYPADIVKYRMEFEINAFCASGQGVGHFLGRATWAWERTKAAALVTGAVVAGPAGTLEQPSQTFMDALRRYASRTHFKLPSPVPP
jgi:hypothetical protein